MDIQFVGYLQCMKINRNWKGEDLEKSGFFFLLLKVVKSTFWKLESRNWKTSKVYLFWKLENWKKDLKKDLTLSAGYGIMNHRQKQGGTKHMTRLEKTFFRLYSFDYDDDTIYDLLNLTEKEFQELKEMSEKRLDIMFPPVV